MEITNINLETSFRTFQNTIFRMIKPVPEDYSFLDLLSCFFCGVLMTRQCFLW